jgi:kynureninase
MEAHAFPSDQYAVASHISSRGRDPGNSLVIAQPQKGELFDHDALCHTIQSQGESLAVVLLPGVQYYTGQVLDIPRLARVAHEHGAVAGFDLAHAVGNLPLHLHDDGVDFAVWCSYKYLNSGPGSIGGCFIHRRHVENVELPRFAGWWGHDSGTRFLMDPEFRAIPTADGWQLSNPSIFSLAALRASLEVFHEAGGMKPLREKSSRMSQFADQLLEKHLSGRVRMVTPVAPDQRGCQLSLQIDVAGVNRSVEHQLAQHGVLCDWRAPNVIRAAPVPLYNSFADIVRFVSALSQLPEERS